MRIEHKVAGRYAEALLGASGDQLDTIGVDLAQVEAVVEASPELRQVLTHPEIPLDRKLALVDRVFEKQVAGPVLAFLRVLVNHQRFEALPAIIDQFRQLADAAQRRVRAYVTSAVPLTAEEESRLTAALTRLTKLHVELVAAVDPAVLAGLAVRIGDRVIDGTARQRLETIRQQLHSN